MLQPKTTQSETRSVEDFHSGAVVSRDFWILTWVFAGNLCQALSQWGFIVCATKLIGIAAAGRYAYANAICTQVVLLTGLHLRSLQGSDLKHSSPFCAYFTLRFLTASVSAGIVAVVALFHRADREMLLLIAFVGLTRVLESLCETSHGHLQRTNRVIAVGQSLLLRGAFSLLAFFLVLARSGSLAYAALASASVTMITLVGNDLRLVRAERFFCHDRSQVERLFLQARSLGLTSLFSTLHVNLPRFLIKGMLGDAALGIYAALAQLPLSAAIFVRSRADVALPELSRWYQDRGWEGHPLLLFAMLRQTSLLFACGGLIAVLFGSAVLTVIYTADHARFIPLLLILIFAEFLSQVTSVLGTAATASRKLHQQPLVVFLALVVLCLSLVALTPTYGLPGAATAAVLTNLLMVCGYIRILRPPVNSTHQAL